MGWVGRLIALWFDCWPRLLSPTLALLYLSPCRYSLGTCTQVAPRLELRFCLWHYLFAGRHSVSKLAGLDTTDNYCGNIAEKNCAYPHSRLYFSPSLYFSPILSSSFFFLFSLSPPLSPPSPLPLSRCLVYFYDFSVSEFCRDFQRRVVFFLHHIRRDTKRTGLI